MRFTPLTEAEEKALGLITPGDYPFEVIKSEDKVSKSGNDMIALTLKVWDENGKQHLVNDWILEAFIKKLIHFCRHTGLDDKYQSGSLMAEHCVGKTGYVKIYNQKGTQKSDGSYYDDKNSVHDYVAGKGDAKPASKPAESKDFAPPFDDDLPF